MSTGITQLRRSSEYLPSAARGCSGVTVDSASARATLNALVEEEIAKDTRGLSPLDVMGMRNKRMHSDASVAAAKQHTLQSSDVFVVTYPKCGTTWVTQIVHGLRSHNDMGFGEITEVVPWDILALDCGQDINGPQCGTHRVFKRYALCRSPSSRRRRDPRRRARA